MKKRGSPEGVLLAAFVLLGGRPPPPPFPEVGADPTPEKLECQPER